MFLIWWDNNNDYLLKKKKTKPLIILSQDKGDKESLTMKSFFVEASELTTCIKLEYLNNQFFLILLLKLFLKENFKWKIDLNNFF